jgi:hypothetical protein
MPHIKTLQGLITRLHKLCDDKTIAVTHGRGRYALFTKSYTTSPETGESVMHHRLLAEINFFGGSDETTAEVTPEERAARLGDRRKAGNR